MNLYKRNNHVTENINSPEGPTLETLDFTIRIGSTPTFLYFDLYIYSAYIYISTLPLYLLLYLLIFSFPFVHDLH